MTEFLTTGGNDAIFGTETGDNVVLSASYDETFEEEYRRDVPVETAQRIADVAEELDYGDSMTIDGYEVNIEESWRIDGKRLDFVGDNADSKLKLYAEDLTDAIERVRAFEVPQDEAAALAEYLRDEGADVTEQEEYDYDYSAHLDSLSQLPVNTDDWGDYGNVVFDRVEESVHEEDKLFVAFRAEDE